MGRLTELGYVSAGEETADPSDYFGKVLFAGGYSQAWEALRQGQVDVSIIAGDVPTDLYEEVLANTRVIEEQGPVPSHSVVFSKDLEDPLRSDLTEALIELGTEENRGLMRRFISGIFLRFERTTTEEHLGTLSRFLEDTRLAYTETIQ
jgi:phosphonate transport system substrate-binding protein